MEHVKSKGGAEKARIKKRKTLDLQYRRVLHSLEREKKRSSVFQGIFSVFLSCISGGILSDLARF